jgi:hypothetical protein
MSEGDEVNRPPKKSRNRFGYYPCVICRKQALKGLMRCQRCHNDFVRKMPDHVGPVVRSGNGSRFSEGEFESLEDQIWFIGEDK